jgi:hypothetical protein
MLIRLLTALAIALTLAFSVAPGGAESGGIWKGADPCTVKYVPGSDRWNQCKGIKKKKNPYVSHAMCRARCSDSSRFGTCMRLCLRRS